MFPGSREKERTTSREKERTTTGKLKFTCGGADLQIHRPGPLRACLALSFTQIDSAVLLTDCLDQDFSFSYLYQLRGGHEVTK